MVVGTRAMLASTESASGDCSAASTPNSYIHGLALIIPCLVAEGHILYISLSQHVSSRK